MSGGPVAPDNSRIRIKGKKASVFRFFLISVAYTIVWITLTSELGYYSKLYGPQVLLQLTIAYYLPSIPILIVSGHAEQLLDEQFGPIRSLLLRLMFGMIGCAVICAWFPFIPDGIGYLLGVVMVLGTVSAIAFSTSYQLVAWFRSADTIALGIGCVGSGPLALLIQIALHMGPTPAKWQWIALFELAAAFAVAGCFSAASLFAQYWKILTGQEPYDVSLPLLTSDNKEEEEEERGSDGSQPAALFLTPRLMSMADPFGGLPWMPGGQLPLPSSFGAYPVLRSRRAASLDSEVSFLEPVAPGRRMHIPKSKSMGAARLAKNLPPFVSPPVNRVSLSQLAALQPLQYTPEQLEHAHGVHSLAARHATSMPGGVQDALGAPLAVLAEVSSVGSASPERSRSPDRGPQPTRMASPFSAVAFDTPSPPPVRTATAMSVQSNAAVVDAAGAHARESEDSSLRQTWQVMKVLWHVVLGSLVSSTLLNLLFPLFTYVPSSGLLPDLLPQVLFYARIFGDIFGRLLPRKKGLTLTSPLLLLGLALLKLAVAVLFVFYLQAPARMLSDTGIATAVAVLWVLGGYINTNSYILAASLVPAKLCPRASALMALTYQMAHFLGLLLATIIAWAMFGDIAGEL